MEGQPVWLISISFARDGVTVATGDMRPPERAFVRDLCFRILDGVGDEARQRLFRMNLTTCLHRAITGAEAARLPASFTDAQAVDLAGGPIEILWENVPQRPSTQPCRHPERGHVRPTRPDLWYPVDCGRCLPCRARAAYPNYTPEVSRP